MANNLKTLRIALLGLGTVGTGVFNVLKRNHEEIQKRAGRAITVTVVAGRNLERAREIVGSKIEIQNDALAVVQRDDVDVVVELIGGDTVAKTLVLKAIEAGKHVVTANKALLAIHGDKIFSAAARKGVIVAYEAAVAGGIPIIKALRESLAANRINWVAGIVNGTTNFILTEMREKGLSFYDALKQAQQLGYAEADPTFDIEGIDAAHKTSLMSAIAFGIPAQFDKAYVEGITKLNKVDIQYAQQLGYRIKLIGITRRTPEGIELRVHPALVPQRRLLASVEGAMNAVMVNGDAVGTTLYYGQGAGSEPTASAVIADLVDIVRIYDASPAHYTPAFGFQAETLSASKERLPIVPIEKIVTSYYLRARVADEAGVLATVANILAQRGISIDALLQREAEDIGGEGSKHTDLIILTHRTQEGMMNDAIEQIQTLKTVLGPIVRLRKEELN